VLDTDERQRRDGLDDVAFAELGQRIAQQRAEFGRMLASGNTAPLRPALRAFLHLCGVNATLGRDDEQETTYAFLKAVITAPNAQAARHNGRAASTPPAPPTEHTPSSWEAVFATWRDYVVGRPRPTTIAGQTAWRQLQRVARDNDVLSPARVTPQLMAQLVEQMRASKLSTSTVNEPIRKVRAICGIAVGRGVLQSNPATETLGLKEPKHMKGRARTKRIRPAFRCRSSFLRQFGVWPAVAGLDGGDTCLEMTALSERRSSCRFGKRRVLSPIGFSREVSSAAA
jgi:hypothetical protein